METVNLKFDVQVASKSKYPTGMLYFNGTYFNYLCTIYERVQEKNFISLRKIVQVKFSAFRFRQHF